MPCMARLATNIKVVGPIVIMYSTKHYESPVLSRKSHISSQEWQTTNSNYQDFMEQERNWTHQVVLGPSA